MRRMMYLSFAVGLIFCAVMFCVCMAAVEAAKDSKPDADGKLMVLGPDGGKTVATNVNSNKIELSKLYTLEVDSLMDLDKLSFQMYNSFICLGVTGFEQKVTTTELSVEIHLEGGRTIISSAAHTKLIDSDGSEVDLDAMQRHRRSLLAAAGRNLLAMAPPTGKVNGDVKEMDDQKMQDRMMESVFVDDGKSDGEAPVEPVAPVDEGKGKGEGEAPVEPAPVEPGKGKGEGDEPIAPIEPGKGKGDGHYPDGHYPDGHYPDGHYPDGMYPDMYPDGHYPDGHYPDGMYPDMYPDGHYPDGTYPDGAYPDAGPMIDGEGEGDDGPIPDGPLR